MEKGDAIKYGILGLVLAGLISMLFVLNQGPTGYVIHDFSGGVVERGSNWNKIDNGDGSYALEIYNDVVNYDGGSGYEEIDTSLQASSYLDYEYEVIGDYKLYIQDNIQSGKGIRFEKDGYYMTYDLSGGKMQWAEEVGNPTKTKSIGSILSSRIIIGDGNVSYLDAFLNTDVQYIIGPNMLKENFILNSLPNPDLVKLYLEYTGEIEQSNDLIVYANGQNYTGKEFSTTGSIEFKDLNNNTIFSLPKPYATDANGDYSDMIYDVKVFSGKIQFGLRVNASWLNNASRTFPVIIDPSIVVNGVNGGDVYVDKSTGNRNHGDKDQLKVQRSTWQRIYLNFDIFAIPVGQVIDNASLCMFLDNDQGSQIISINHVTDDSWCEGDGGTDASPSCEITWNNQPCGNDENVITGSCNATVEDTLVTDTGLDDTFQCFNIKNMLSTDYAGDKNLSIVLWTLDTGSADIFASKEDTNSSRWPYLDIDYYTANTGPSISIDLPNKGNTYGYNTSIALNFSVSDVDSNIDSCWYNFDNGINASITNCLNTSFDIAEGSHDLNIFVNDSFGLESSDNVSFSVVLGAPTIVLSSPIDSYLASQSVEFNYTPTDVDLDSCWLLGNFTGVYRINQTDTGVSNGVTNSFNLNLGDGNYIWNIGCNDSQSNFAINGNQTFYVDTADPNLSLSEPSGAKTSKTGIPIIFNINDTNLDKCYYNLTTSIRTPVVNDVEVANCTDITFEVSADGDYIIYLWADDFAGNSKSVNSSFSVDLGEVVIVVNNPGGGSNSPGGGGTYIPSNTSGLGKLEISELGSIIAHEGDLKNLSINVKNKGLHFVNNCKLIVSGEISSWIYSKQIEGLAPGENIDFIFNLNVPEEIGKGDYFGDLEIKCDEGHKIQNFSISVPGLEMITVKEIIQDGKFVKIKYNFDNSYVIGDAVSVDIWIQDSEGYEITRIQDFFDINKQELIERNVEVEFEGAGIYSVYFALSNDLENFVKESIVLGESSVTGFAILDNVKNKKIIYIIFVVILFIGVFFIWKSHGKRDESNLCHKKSSNNQHSWLMGKHNKK